MDIVKITENNIGDAGKIHSESWKESHKSFCSEGFVARHTEEAQTEYIRSEIAKGKDFYMLIVHIPVGIVSIYDNVIENFYIIPSEQRKGYGAILLQYVLKQYKKYGFIESGKKKQLRNDLFEVELILCNER